MRRSVNMALLVLALGLVLRAPLSEANGLPKDVDPPIDADTPGGNAMPADSRTDVVRASPRRFELSRVDDDIIKGFEKAWTISNNGTSGKEGLVLLFQALEACGLSCAGCPIAGMAHKQGCPAAL